MSEKKYTAEDFAKAQAATLNRTRGLGGRVDHGDSLPWLILSEDDRRWVRDEDMAAGGWVPVPSSPAKPTITAGEVGRRSHLVRGGNVETPSLVDFLEALGIEVVPDPVPSNAELLARDLDELNGDGFLIHNRHKEMIANLLIERGWVKQSVGEAR